MEKLLKKGHYGFIIQFKAIHVLDIPTLNIHSDLYMVMKKHHQVFETLRGITPS